MHKIHNHCIRTSSPASISRISSSIPRLANPTLASRSLQSSSRAFSSIDKPVVSRQAPANANSSLVTSKIHNSTTTCDNLIPNISGTHRTYAAMATEGKQGVHNLTSKKDFDAALSDKEQVMVVDFFATWCGPCKVIAPQVVKMSDTYPTARFYKLDVDEVPDVAQELGIRAMPTFVLFKGGEKISEVVGANPKALEAAIQGAI